MPKAKVTDADFIDFLIATPRQATATEAQRTQPPPADPRVGAAAHDAYTRLLHRLEPDAEILWDEVRPDDGLTADESVRLQAAGLGGRRLMGCGLFLPGDKEGRYVRQV